ncbi:MAG: hypothetical protein ACLFTH_04825 [Candidatus Woesearchaeota archaeon]
MAKKLDIRKFIGYFLSSSERCRFSESVSGCWQPLSTFSRSSAVSSSS